METRIVTLMAVFIVQSVDGLDNTRARLGATSPKVQIPNEKSKSAVYEYNKKVCANEPTCDLLNTVPEYLHKIPYRDCMCDVNCITYGDCCRDSKYYSQTEQSRNYLNFYCATATSAEIYVYVKNKCSSNFTDLEAVNKCHIVDRSFRSIDHDLIALVTDPIENITYANEYCAQCNRIVNYVSWNVSYNCNRRGNHLKTDNNLLEKVTQSVKFDEKTRKFYADFEGIGYDCSQHITPPVTKNPIYLRNCLSLISSCQNITDNKIVGECESDMSIVYHGQTAYKNKYCAKCNGVLEKQVSGCIDIDTEISPPGVAFSTDWAAGNKAGGSGACGSNANEAINRKFSCE